MIPFGWVNNTENDHGDHVTQTLHANKYDKKKQNSTTLTTVKYLNDKCITFLQNGCFAELLRSNAVR